MKYLVSRSLYYNDTISQYRLRFLISTTCLANAFRYFGFANSLVNDNVEAYAAEITLPTIDISFCTVNARD